MEYEKRPSKAGAQEGDAGEQRKQSTPAARPPPDDALQIGQDGLVDGDVAASPEAMVTILRVAKYEGRIHEGLLRFQGDLSRAIEFAQGSPDGLTDEEHAQSLAIITSRPEWENLLRRLADRAAAEIQKEFVQRRNSES